MFFYGSRTAKSPPNQLDVSELHKTMSKSTFNSVKMKNTMIQQRNDMVEILAFEYYNSLLWVTFSASCSSILAFEFYNSRFKFKQFSPASFTRFSQVFAMDSGITRAQTMFLNNTFSKKNVHFKHLFAFIMPAYSLPVGRREVQVG